MWNDADFQSFSWDFADIDAQIEIWKHFPDSELILTLNNLSKLYSFLWRTTLGLYILHL